jgi:hypothetical protein
MGSLYLNGLTPDQRKQLERQLHGTQKGNCFICGLPVDLTLHANATDVDHVEPIKTGGKDDPSNFALTHASCNRSKQASDLRVARVLATFGQIRDAVEPENRGPNLGDVLLKFGGAKHGLHIKVEGNCVSYSLPEIGRNEVCTIPLYRDDLSGLQYFFVKLPLSYLFHDEKINPRSVGGSLSGLVEEFFKKRPQLHVALAWAENLSGNGQARIQVFDGQHKTTAQVLLGVKGATRPSVLES